MPKKELRVTGAAVAVLFGLFLALPLCLLLVNAFLSGGSLSLNNIQGVFGGKNLFSSLMNSFTVSAVSAGATVIIAFVMAYTVNYTGIPKPLKSALSVLATLPMLFPTITYGFAIIYSFGKQGLVTGALGHLPFEIYGFGGLTMGYICYTVPTAFLLLNNTFQYIDKKFLTVSQLMGDSPARRFVSATLRPMAATLGTAFIQAFFLCFTDFGIPAAVGGEYNVIASVLYNQMLGAAPDFGRGAVVALLMLLPSVLSILLQAKLDKTNVRYSKISPVELKKSPLRDGVLGCVSLLLLGAMLSIFAVVFLIPFVGQWPYDKSASVAFFWNRLSEASVVQTLGNSLLIAFLTAAVGTVVAFLCGVMSERGSAHRKVRGSVNGLALVTNTVPGMVLGVAYMLAFSGTPLQNTLVVIVLSNLVHFFSTPYFMAKNALSKMNGSWETTAALMGDNWLKTLFRVIVPNSVKTLTEIFSYYFINAMVTVSAVIFIAGARTMVLTTKIKELQHYGKFEEIFVLSLLIFAVNLGAKLLFRLAEKAAERRPKIKNTIIKAREAGENG